MIRLLKYIVFLLLCTSSLLAQTKPAKIWATASFNKSEVQLGEPLVVTITVYTSTWFSKPPIFEEIQVKGSLMAKLEQRNSATSVTIGRKQYPAIKQRFVIYPNVIGTNKLPTFKVITNCPPEGGYKSITREVYTKEREFTVVAPPDLAPTTAYLAAYNLNLSESWSTDFKYLKAGDVIERQIRISASGALAAAIPPLQVDSLDFGSAYIKSPQLSNQQNANSFSGTRTENITYLLEKDGEFKIPTLEVSWFNLKTKTFEIETLKSTTLNIAKNPDLNFILSRQQELQAELEANTKTEQKVQTPFSVLGLNWWQFTLVVLVFIILARWIFKLGHRLKIKREKKHFAQLQSEAYFFKQLKLSLKQGSNEEIIRDFYAWYDRYRNEQLGPQISELIEQLKLDEIKGSIEHNFENYYKHNSKLNLNNLSTLIKTIEHYKSHNITTKTQQNKIQPINP